MALYHREMEDSRAASALHFRLASEADISLLVPMVNEAFAIETFMGGTRTSPERMGHALQKGMILVAEDAAGKPAGCAYMEVRGERGYLGMLAVNTKMQHRGIARQITAEAERRLRAAGCTLVEIVVLSERRELFPIYRKWGFAEKANIPFDPGRPVQPGFKIHGVQMEKPLA